MEQNRKTGYTDDENGEVQMMESAQTLIVSESCPLFVSQKTGASAR